MPRFSPLAILDDAIKEPLNLPDSRGESTRISLHYKMGI